MRRETPGDTPVELRAYGRRTFLAVTGVGLTSLLWAKPVWQVVSERRSRSRTRCRPGRPRRAGASTPSPSTMPRFDPATWRLRVDGLVERPLTLTYEELRALPRAEQVSDFHCVTGWSCRHVHWAGVRFRDLLATAGPQASAHASRVRLGGAPVRRHADAAQAALADAMLAYEMDGKPLPREHGAPVRVVIPEMYGYKNVKWVERIVVARPPSSRATGSSAATTSTPGSAARMVLS